jgi:outer membrane protein assembly factor BamA
VASIRVIGSRHFAEPDIVATTGLKIGESVTPERLRTVADALSATGAFEQVRYDFGPEKAGMTVRFTVSDASEILPVEFENFVWFSKQQLIDAVHERVPLFRGKVPSQGEMTTRITDTLRGLLTARGIPGEVTFCAQGDPSESGTGGAVFRVQGVDIRIRDVSFPGAAPTEVTALQAACKHLLQTPYEESALAGYADTKLRPVYTQSGYLKVAFGHPAVTVVSTNPAEPLVSLAIPVSPGLQYRLGAIRWSGNKVFQSLDLQQQIQLKVGDPVNLVELQRGIEAVHNLYAARGYLRQNTEEIPALDDSVKVASYELRISEGDLYRFASIEITGLEPDVRDIVREEWKLREGEPYDPGHIRAFLDAALPLMKKGAVTQVQQDINDTNKTVEVGIHFDFQEPIKEPPTPATPAPAPTGRKRSR